MVCKLYVAETHMSLGSKCSSVISNGDEMAEHAVEKIGVSGKASEKPGTKTRGHLRGCTMTLAEQGDGLG